MIYLESSVALAELRGEARRPPPEFWNEGFVSSRLLQYEVWVVAHARGIGEQLAPLIGSMIRRVALVDMVPEVLERTRSPMPVPVRTLDAIHLATLDYLHRSKRPATLASYDQRLLTAARALGFKTIEP